MGYHVVDGCPVPQEAYGFVAEAHRRGIGFNSIYRGDDARAELHANGKSSQFELYWGYTHGLPGFNPANPPGRSTHECRSDGIAYAGPLGRRLAGWQVGLDSSQSDELDRVLSSMGISSRRPYSGGSEYHHRNVTSKPQARWLRAPVPTLRLGSRSKYVRYLTRKLSFIPRVNAGTFLHGDTAIYTVRVRQAVVEFQRSHDLPADGVCGPKTYEAVDKSFRYWKKHPLKRRAWIRRGRP